MELYGISVCCGIVVNRIVVTVMQTGDAMAQQRHTLYGMSPRTVATQMTGCLEYCSREHRDRASTETV